MLVEYCGFEWDSDKNEINKQKHGISFEIATRVFNDPYVIEKYDIDHSLLEDRTAFLGLVYGVIILFVIHTDRNGRTRIISARKATKKERKDYERNRQNL